jgi:phage shock protein C
MNNKLYRSNRDVLITGLCGGIAEYFGIDASLVRIISLLLVLGTGFGWIVYIVGAIIVPKRPY